MNQTSSPSGAASENDAAPIASIVSQWLYLHTALGKGYVAPFQYSPAWVISSGVPAELVHRMRTAENDFHDKHEKSLAQDHARLEQLEQMAQATKRSGVSPAVTTEIKELKARLARPVFVNYRDWSADKSTMLELLSKSKFRAMSFVDEMGIRAHNYTVNKFLATRHISSDMELLSLTGDQGCDSVLIRSSATGGASMLSVRGNDTPRFNLMTLTSPQAIAKIAPRLKEVAPAVGVTLILPHKATDCLAVSADQIAKVIAKVYATDTADNRVVVTMTPDWAAFMQTSDTDVAKGVALKQIERSLASVQTLVRSIARAVITRKIFLTENEVEGPESSERTLALDAVDLQIAREWFAAIHQSVLGLKNIEARMANLAAGRQAWESGPSVESCIEAKMALIKLIQGDPDGVISARDAARAPGITARSLDVVLESCPGIFKVLCNHRRPGAKRKSKRSIILQDGWEDEVEPVGGDPSGPGAEIDNQMADSLYRQWQDEAAASFAKGGHPSVPVAAEIKSAVLGVQKRHWQTTTILPSGAKNESNGKAGLELWFRLGPTGGDMCSWRDCFTEWHLDAKWQDKDEAAKEDREQLLQAAEWQA